MLHEVLLALSGHHSPLWDQINVDEGNFEDGNAEAQPWRMSIAPPEKAMLATLAHLSDLHIKIRDHATHISTSHPSMICRSVASVILSKHLGDFRKKIVSVETSILTKDAAFVGAYDIVPLSTVVGEFAPWTRRLEWLWLLTQYVEPIASQASKQTARKSGAVTIDYLEKERYTGYNDIEEMVSHLLIAAETAWIKHISMWVLYGKLPTYGAHDFFIQKGQTSHLSGVTDCEIQPDLVPNFVTPATASSILSIGDTLNQIRHQNVTASRYSSRSNADVAMALLPQHLEHLSSLSYPLSSANFSTVITSIKISISQNALSQLLPLPTVLEILEISQQFLLLGRGEFATSMITHADAHVASRHLKKQSSKPVRKVGRLDDLTMKEAEVAAVLKQAWAELAALQNNEDVEDDILESARTLLCLELENDDDTTDDYLISTLLPAKTLLRISLPPSSPLNLFLSATDMKAYSSINAYLISLRRAELHLSNLWKLTPSRRSHPHPLGPPASATRHGQAKLEAQRARDDSRSVRMRKYWATASKAVFVLNELDAYLHGEIISNSWTHFRQWIDDLKPAMSAPQGSVGSRPGTASSTQSVSQKLKTSQLSDSREEQPSDPATLAQAHQSYLRALKSALLLSNCEYIDKLRELLTLIDHFIALFSRLEVAHQGLDLQESTGVVDVLSSFGKDEKETLEEMERSRQKLEETLKDLVAVIQNVGPAESEEDTTHAIDDMDGLTFVGTSFVPWRTRTIDRLVMKLGFLSGDDRNELGLVDLDDD